MDRAAEGDLEPAGGAADLVEAAGVASVEQYVVTEPGEPLLMRSSKLHDARLVSGVEVAGRLIGQQHQRPVDERPRDRHPLLLTAGQLVRQPLGLAIQADQLEHLGHRALDGRGDC